MSTDIPQALHKTSSSDEIKTCPEIALDEFFFPGYEGGTSGLRR
jgi:hypothetical protein